MRIMYDGELFQWQRVGGMSRYFRELIPRIAARAEYSVYLYKRGEPFYFASDGNVTVLSAPQYPISSDDSKYWEIVRRARNSLSFRSESMKLSLLGIDLIHCTFFSTVRIKAPVVLTVYDLIYEKMPELYPSEDQFRRIRGEAVHSAAHIICISESTRRDLISIYGIAQERTSVVYLGSSLSTRTEVASARSISKERDELSFRKQPFVLYVGAFWPHKNVLRLFEAFASWRFMDEVMLVCAGGDQRWTRRETDALDCLGIRDRVHILGDISDADLATLYRNAECLIYPSLYEGFGLPIVEAMAHGCVVASSNTSSMPEVAGDCAIYFDPYDIEAIRDAMTRVMQLTAAERQQLISAGSRRAAEFTWERTAAETCDIYQRVTK